jgi:IS5 family transposase
MNFVADLALVLLAALSGGLLAQRLGQPLIVGCILAGIVVGPFTIGPTVDNIGDIEQLAELGVVLLLFSLGLELSFRELTPVRAVALGGATIQIVLTIALGLALGRALGWPWQSGLWLGALISLSSTMVALKNDSGAGTTGDVRRGGQRRHSDLAIETGLRLRLLFHLPLRQAEGFLNSLFAIMNLELSAPDHTTLSRRGQHLPLTLRRAPTSDGMHLVVDSTGLSMVGEGEWAAAKHGGRGTRGWKKLHLGVDAAGVIVAHALTGATVDDATTAIGLIAALDGDVASVTADTAYDTIAFYDAAGVRGARVVVPPAKTASVSRRTPRSSARDRTISAVNARGRRRWKRESGYYRQARVENGFFRYKSIISERLRARSRAGQESEAALACNILNRMTELGRPASYRIGR